MYRGLGGLLMFEEAVDPMGAAVDRRQLEFVKLLLANGYDVNHVDSEGNTILDAAVAFLNNEIDIQIVETLLAAGADPNHAGKNGIAPLLRAAARNSVRVVQALLAAGADVNVWSPRARLGGMPLTIAAHMAAAYEDDRSLKALVVAGADVGLALQRARQYNESLPPLMRVASSRTLLILETLYERRRARDAAARLAIQKGLPPGLARANLLPFFG